MPIATNECTANPSSVSYARVLIEVDFSMPLSKAILVEDEEGQVHDQAFFIEWVPHFLSNMPSYRHIIDESRQGPKARHAVKVVKKSITILSSVPK